MELAVSAYDLSGNATEILLKEIPDTCPRCHRAIHPKHSSVSFTRERNTSQTVFRCVHHGCQELFIGNYADTFSKTNLGKLIFTLKSITPISAKSSDFPHTVQAISPSFVEIHNQAIVAESHNLSQLVGVGLRKSLEFLIKDFALSEHPEQADKIRDMLLGPCITQYVSEPNIKECARRAAWLGNDETHYTRRWENKDIDDLKLLVRLTVNWIDNSILTKKYIHEMGG